MVAYTFDALRTMAAVSGAVIAIGFSAGALAQTQAQSPAPGETMQRCQQLISAWNRYNGGSSYSKQVDVEASFEQCRNGNLSAGIAGLTRALQRQQIPVPPVETASPPPQPAR